MTSNIANKKQPGLTVIVPAFNEESSIADTIISLQSQVRKPEHIVVVDDFSTDNTGKIARSLGVEVIKPPKNTGSKAGAQNFALKNCKTEFVMALDADTTLAKNAIEKLEIAFDSPKVAAACGFVLPRIRQTLWERARYTEYLIAFTFYKPVQDYFGKPLISSGCFSMYRTDILQKLGGWSTRTMAEDMDLTWSYYELGFQVRFIADAVCYPLEPHNLTFMKKQLKRWSHGFVQNVRLHYSGVIKIPYLNIIVTIATWDALVASTVFLFGFPLLAVIFKNPSMLLAYIIDAPIILVPVVYAGITNRNLKESLINFPAFFILRIVNAYFILEAFWSEMILNKKLSQYEKGH